jgi:hypothetical protein
MYCIKKFADCWAIFNLESEYSRSLTDDEVLKVRREIPELNASDVLSYYTDEIDCIEDKP